MFVDKRILLRHVGTYTFDYNTHEQLYKDLKVMFEPTAAVVAPEATHELISDANPAAEPEVMASSKKKAKKVAAAA